MAKKSAVDGQAEGKERMAFYLSLYQLEKVRVLAHVERSNQSQIVGDLIDAAKKPNNTLPPIGVLSVAKSTFRQATDEDKKRMAFWLSDSQRQKVKALAFDQRTSQSKILGDLIDAAKEPGIMRG